MTGPSYSAAEIAARFGLELRGDGETGISSVATLARAGAGQLAFLANPRYRNQLSESAASAVVMRADDAQGHDRSEEHTSELQSLMRISYAVFCLKKKPQYKTQ